MPILVGWTMKIGGVHHHHHHRRYDEDWPLVSASEQEKVDGYLFRINLLNLPVHRRTSLDFFQTPFFFQLLKDIKQDNVLRAR